jgi:hypothetical protein
LLLINGFLALTAGQVRLDGRVIDTPIVVGKMFGANAALGFRLAFYGSRLRAADVVVQILGIVLMGLAASQAVRLAERRFALGRVAGAAIPSAAITAASGPREGLR